MLRRPILLGPLLAAALAPAAASAQAGAWPNRPVRLIAPFAPGGQTDLVSRLVAERLGTALGQPIIVENRLGGGSSVGAAAAARSPADGYTIVFGTPGMVGT
mgnify:FL=1